MDTNTSHSKVGPIIGAIVIVILLVIAALFAWGHRLNKKTAGANSDASDQAALVSDQQAQADAADATTTVTAQPKMSTSDDIDSLSNDLNSINTSNSQSF